LILEEAQAVFVSHDAPFLGGKNLKNKEELVRNPTFKPPN